MAEASGSSSIAVPQQPASIDRPSDDSRLVRTRKACLACRAIKAKCTEPDVPEEAPPAQGGPHACKRCARLKIPCKFEVDKRTQRHSRPASKKAGQQAVPAPVQQAPDYQQNTFLNGFGTASISPPQHTHLQSVISHFPDHLTSQDPTAQSAIQQHQMQQYPIQQPLQHNVMQQQASPTSGMQHPIQQYPLQHPQQQLSGQQPSPSSPGRPVRSAGDYATLVEAVDATIRGTKKRPKDTDPDPLSMSILNMAEANSLVTHFHNKLGPFLNMFDPILVTAESLQQESAVLFSAVLSTAAKFYRPDIYKSLLQHAKQLVTRRLLAARYDIHLLQSLLLLAHWREVADASAFVNVGAAIRMGYQLELHTSHSVPTQDAEDPLMQLNRQRTWLQLICYDTTYRLRSKNSRSPSMIPLDMFPRDPSQWLNESSSASDKQLVFSVELTRTVRIIEDGLSSESASDTAVSYFVSLFEQFRLKWIDGAIQWDVLRDAKCRWAYWYMGFKLHISTATNERFERSLGGLLSAAENTVSAALKLFSLDMIDYLPDSNAFQILYIGERLSMLHEILHFELKEKLAAWMQQIYSAANVSVVSGKGETLPSYFVARYFDILLQEMQKPGSRQNTRPPSRAQSPAAAPMPLDFGNAADLSNNVSAWLNGSDFDIFGGVMQFETDYASLRQTFAQDLNWTDLLTNPL